jgi:hypothetical protein
MNKVQQLELSAALAPVIRELPLRKVKVYSAETGEVKGEVLLSEVAIAAGKRVILEFGVQEGVKPKKIQGKCGHVFTYDLSKPTSLWCPKCRILMCGFEGCTNFASELSSRVARCIGGKTYCEEHKGGARAPLPCTICGKPAGKNSSYLSRSRGTKPYCAEHARGPKLLILPCAVCGKSATKKSSKKARQRGHKAYCAEHSRGGK